MAARATLSPRPNPPGPGAPGQSLQPKAKALAILNASKSPGPGPSTDRGIDLAEQMNDEVRQQYVIGKRLGEGTYATVYEGHIRGDPTKLVAIKKMKKNADYKDGIQMDAIREVRFLSELDHPNVVKLHAVFSTKDQNISLVLEHLPAGDLEMLWKNQSCYYQPADIKSWANMLMQAVWFIHENYILHRDIKSNNVLVAADGTIKLADFGLARSFATPELKMTYVVITRYYRPPELFYGARHYGPAVDIWSVGVVLAELAIRTFFIESATDLEHISRLTEFFGTPTEETWPGVSKLQFYTAPGADAKRPQPLSYWQQKFNQLGPDGVDMLRGMLTMDPKKRLTARQVLAHRYWTNLPKPTKKEALPKQGGGKERMVDNLKRQGGDMETGRTDKVARKLDFSSMRQ